MKMMILASLIAIVALSTAQAHDRCGMPQGAACNKFLSKFDAFKRIQANENDQEQTIANLSLVESVARQHNLNLEYVVDNFIHLQQALGGANATDVTQNAFHQINRSIGAHSLHALVDVFVDNVKIENDTAQTSTNYELILSGVSRNVSLKTSSHMFRSLLQMQGGANATDSAQASYRKLISLSGQYSINDLLSAWSKIFKSENDFSHATQNFNLVIRSARLCGSITVAAQDFVDVLKQVGGANATEQAQALYIQLYNL